MKTYILIIISGDRQNEMFVITTEDIKKESCFEFKQNEENVLKYNGEFYTYDEVTVIK